MELVNFLENASKLTKCKYLYFQFIKNLNFFSAAIWVGQENSVTYVSLYQDVKMDHVDLSNL